MRENRKKIKRKPRCTSREKKVLQFPKKNPCILAMYVYLGESTSQMQNVRALAQKVEFLNTDMSNSRDVLQRKFREEEECMFAPVCSEGSSRICLSPVNPATLLHVIKRGANFHYSYKYHCLKKYYTSQKFRDK